MRLSFFSPWLLLGGLAIGVPLILHFFYRARYRKLPWGAMSFLKIALEQTSRRLRFQEWILLALRCLLLLLIAFALARPFLDSAGTGGKGDAVDVVFVFDSSYSMGARDGDATRLARAKDAARAVLENLPRNSTVRVLSCADRTIDHGPVAPGNFDQVRQAIDAIELTSLSTDYLPGMDLALETLRRNQGTNKEVWLFSDLGKSGFERQAAPLKNRMEEIHKEAAVLLVRCGDPNVVPANAAIVDITFPSAVPHVGARMPFTVLLRNSGSQVVANAAISLEVDGEATAIESVTVPSIGPGQTIGVPLTALLTTSGRRVVTAKLTTDEVPGDNRFDRALYVRDRLNVLIVDGEPDRSDARDAASHFIRNSLAPIKALDADGHFIHSVVVTPDEAGPGLLAGCDLVVLANVAANHGDKPGLAGDFVLRLAQYVKDGGSLIIGSGDNVLPERYNAVLGNGGVRLLPYDLEIVLNTTIAKPFRIAGETIDAGSYLSRFREEPYRTANSEVEVRKLIDLGPGDAQSRVLMRTTDSRPLVALRSIGLGEVLFVTTTLDTKWTNWPAKAGAYVSFVQLTLAHLTNRRSRSTTSVAGEPLLWNPPEFAKSFDLVRPDGTRLFLGKPDGGGNEPYTIKAADVPLAGIHRFESQREKTEDGKDESKVKSPPFTVNADLRESDTLEMMSREAIGIALGFEPAILQAGAGTEDTIARERSRREWTIWLLLLVFVLAMVELGWAMLCGRAW